MQTINISIDIPVSIHSGNNEIFRHLISSDSQIIPDNSDRADIRNVEIDIDYFCRDVVGHISFSRPTKNNVINGTFTKIIMTFPYVTIMGLCINTPIVAHRRIRDISKTTIFSSKFSNANIALFKILSTIEDRIIHKFKATHNSSKIAVFSLKEHLYNSSIKIFNNRESNNTSSFGIEDPIFETHLDAEKEEVLSENEICSSKTLIENRGDLEDDSHLSQLIRISGVWESSTSVGIIYKFLETRA